MMEELKMKSLSLSILMVLAGTVSSFAGASVWSFDKQRGNDVQPAYWYSYQDSTTQTYGVLKDLADGYKEFTATLNLNLGNGKTSATGFGIAWKHINKESLHMAGHFYSGHTEIFAEYTNTKKYAMLLTSKSLRVIHVTTHVPLRQACEMIKKDRLLNVIKIADDAMKSIGIKKPRIAVAGLNPHASENGLFGDEEAKEIIPAVKEAQEQGFNVEGPIPPDTVFVKAMGGQYDIVVAMYHDQGHIPLKLSGFKLNPKTGQYVSMSGVNCTLGLPIIRTSVDHGTAFGKAGEGRANEESMIDAIDIAILMAENRK